MKKHILILTMVLFALSACTSSNDSKKIAMKQNKATLSESELGDAKFAVIAFEGSMMEVQLGQLAQTNASDASVKAFGTTMADDHTRGNNELKAIATRKNITLPTTIGEKHQKEYNDLAKKTGSDFDKEYMDMMVEDHEKDIKLFEKEANEGKDEELKMWASMTLATLRKHLEMAKGTESMVKK
jgi:putative membrane protein